MPQITMYPGQVNSPAAELAENINASQTTIPMDNASILPDAPNICTISIGEDAETILYLGKDGNNLIDVTRGFEGPAKSWNAGTKVRRLFTAYDYNSLRQNQVAHLAQTAIHESTEIPTANRIAMFDSNSKLKIPKNTQRNLTKNDNFFRPTPIVFNDSSEFEVGSNVIVPINELRPGYFSSSYQAMLLNVRVQPGATGHSYALYHIGTTNNSANSYSIFAVKALSGIDVTYDSIDDKLVVMNNTGGSRILTVECMMF
ncbi:hypothetical protein CACET_c31720 [Clostridium aceticum]|uniref:Uncharacterized protein n=1 Tax=Clostridium aceticum TaxID=84022 RepID=A0A0D8I755_9CLOT|nr:hypothetical protein [Clostridium aceticum]AKL96616.1 hypothetical protein CACET_c31720 [Clostridium aceticum]KJF26078.1 hypothetical protein TZ02_15270 [Clostridium aceticum]